MSQSAVPDASTPRVRRRSEAVNIDHGQLVGRHLNRFAIVMDLHELAPVGRWATSGRHRWWLERIAEVCENLTSRGLSHPGIRPLANLRFEVSRLLPAVCSEPDVTAAVRALKRKFSPTPGHEFRPGNPCRVVRAGLLIRIRVTTAPRGATAGRRSVSRPATPCSTSPSGCSADAPKRLPITTLPMKAGAGRLSRANCHDSRHTRAAEKREFYPPRWVWRGVPGAANRPVGRRASLARDQERSMTSGSGDVRSPIRKLARPVRRSSTSDPTISARQPDASSGSRSPSK